MNNKILKDRILERVEDVIEEEFARFECETSRMSEDEEKIGQATLTEYEKKQLPMGNQNSNLPTIIEYQVIKAAAIKYDVVDWVSKVDPQLTYEENVELMKREGSGETLRYSGEINARR